ncbi:hypothetical protein F2P56_007909 [Juglans regia]|uniref:Uncharacterized protein LOC108979280 n=2 Tax=Juglans regia TaxID=51240 RepID=A0A2I4DEA7_JUGRE|nr:uncharacterized protein LOC108979280 [Juglans regia]KAF5476174.1 hypothetical protein F2P56_007909 [Juglans regia]
MEKLLGKVDKTELSEIATVMRSLWLRRNEFCYEGLFKSPSQMLRTAKEELHEFEMAQQKLIANSQGNNIERRNQVWQRPKENYIKVNWDAALDLKGRKAGLGVIIRDEDGEPLVAVEGQQTNVVNPAIVEIYALWKAMEIYRDLKMERVIFEGDAQLIVKAVNSQEEDRSVYGSIVEVAKSLLGLWKGWSVEFVYRNEMR